MSALTPSTAHRSVRNQATIDWLDNGPGVAEIRLYTVASGDLLAVRKLGKPCGTINAQGRIVLAPSKETDLVAISGTPTYGELRNANGELAGFGTVTDESGDGVFKIKGSTTLLEGGVLMLVTPALLG